MRRTTGTPGDDELFPFLDEDNELLGISGDDTLFPGPGADTLDGGEGNDWVYYRTFDGDTPVFSVGVDIRINEGFALIPFASGTVQHVLLNIENARGSNANDTIAGNDAANEIQAFDGNDNISAGGGDDRIFAGSGDDTVNGGDGDDSLFAMAGNEVLDGGAGRDTVFFATTLGGAPVFNNGVIAELSNGKGSAQIDGETFSYSLLNLSNLEGSNFADTLTGNDEDNTLQGRSGDDVVLGLAGNDSIFSGTGNDQIDGGTGDDSLFASSGNETLEGGDGTDWVMFSTYNSGTAVFNEGVDANLSTASATAQIGGETYVYAIEGFENLRGGDFDDTLTGNDGANELQGFDGNDRLLGLGGDDQLFGGSGDDTLEGGAGNDELFANDGNTLLDGGDGEDWALFNTATGGEAVFTNGVVVDMARESASGVVDQISYDYTLRGIVNLAGSNFSDTLMGDAQNNRIEGRDGDDIIKGGAGDDDINGGGGNDLGLYDGASTHFTVRIDFAQSELFIIDRTGAEGTDTGGTNILSFSDRDFTLEADGTDFYNDVALSVEDYTALVELYIAYFNRAPDAEGLNFWTLAFLNGTTLDQAANFFFDQPETRALYGTDIDRPAFVTQVYENVLGRGPDDEGRAFWVDGLTEGSVTEGGFIRAFLQGARAEPPSDASPEFQAQVTADRAYLDAKTDIGLNYATVLGMSDIDRANTVMSLFDGSDESLAAAQSSTQEAYDAAIASDGSGAFLLQIVGLVDDPFAVA